MKKLLFLLVFSLSAKHESAKYDYLLKLRCSVLHNSNSHIVMMKINFYKSTKIII